MNIKAFLPENEKIQEHVAYYFIFNFEEQHISKTYFNYPGTHNLVTICNNFSTELIEGNLMINEIEEKKFRIDITGRFTKAIPCKINGKIKGITIVFKPLGINHFCEKSFTQILPETHSDFPYWKNEATALEALLNSSDIKEIGRKLDAILLSFFRPFENKIVSDTLRLLHEDFTNNNVTKIEQTLHVNRKMLLRQFKKHLGVSITDYRRILRFREAILLLPANNENLTQLAYESHFSDQSHFIKDIQKLAGESPGNLFKQSDLVKGTPFFIKAK